MSNALEFKADLEDIDSDKSKLQFAQGGNPDLLKPMKQSDAHLVVQDTDDRTLMMLQAFEGRA